MSDAPQADGWWQASDQKWYPPQDSPRRSSPRWVLSAVVLVVVALVSGVTTFVLVGGDQSADAATVLLEPVDTAGPDPFTESVSIVEVAQFPDAVNAVIIENAVGLDRDGPSGTLRANGDAPGLYGGSRDDAACDVEALDRFLTDPSNAAKAAAWARVAGIESDRITEHLATLTPTVLTLDTRVTNHGFSGGVATPRQSVLQAGTAVLVDDRGVPAVRCSCGNPLAEPTAVELATAPLSGSAWTSYLPERVATPAPGHALDAFTVLDVVDGDPFQLPAGSVLDEEATPEPDPAAPDGLLVAAVTSYAEPGRGDAAVGSLHVSEDGATWRQVVADLPFVVADVAYGGGRLVAVGGNAYSFQGEPGGYVLTSVDGTEWSEPERHEHPFVAVVHEGGRFLALAARLGATGSGSDGGAIVYQSADGSDWEPIGEFASPEGGSAAWRDLVAGDGQYAAIATTCLGDACTSEVFISADARQWGPTRLGAIELGATSFGNGRFITSGFSGDDFRGYESFVALGTDLYSFERIASSPEGLTFDAFAVRSGGWVAASSPPGETPRIWASPDAATWQELGRIDGPSELQVGGLAVVG